MCDKRIRYGGLLWRILLVVLGLFIVYRVIQRCSASKDRSELSAEVERIRQLAASGDPALVALLEQSMVFIPEGEFLMGSDNGRDDERPPRQVYLDAYEIDRYEVTHIQYQRFIMATGHRAPRYWRDDDYPHNQADLPVVGVGWRDADAYCIWAGKRLPTEAEWEKACRGTDGRIYPWGNIRYPARANVGRAFEEVRPEVWEQAWSLLLTDSVDQGTGPHPVGTYLKGVSPYGVLDLVGNASEWVGDWYNWEGYWDLPERNPQVLDPPWNRCLRGSSWFMPNGDTVEGKDRNRCSARNSSHASTGDARTGFRCARSVSE